jgi:hypothetical protein
MKDSYKGINEEVVRMQYEGAMGEKLLCPVWVP